MTHDPMTTPEDRLALKWCSMTLGATVFLIATIGLARAEPEEDGGPMRATAGMQAYAKAEYSGRVVGGRPEACRISWKGKLIPFCGCALSVKKFGRVVENPNLKLAATWKQVFPKAKPAPGMVAARSGHVFELISHVRNDIWLVWDPNSGGGKIRIHERSIAGYVVVNPSEASL